MNDTLTEDDLRGLAAPYALGALDEGEASAFEAHLYAGCEPCEEELRGFMDAAAMLALAAPPAAPPSSVRERLLARVRDGVDGEPAAEPERPASQFVGASDFLVVRAGEGEWVETPDPGVFVKLLFVDREHHTMTTLVRLAPGGSITPHRHHGVEQCLVLEGEVRSGEATLRAGDFNCAMSGSVHGEIRSDGGALLLIVAPAGAGAPGGAGAPQPRP